MGRVLGLLGGVGSGKSTVARLLADRGLVVLDADAEARAAVGQPAILAALVRRFGPQILAPDGRLDRAALARRAFVDPASTEALNALVHPAVQERIRAGLAAAGERTVVLDVPLLLESPLADLVSDWIFIDSPEAVREQRVAARGWDPGERARREARQADLAAKRARAGHVLENDGDLGHLGRQVEALLLAMGLT